MLKSFFTLRVCRNQTVIYRHSCCLKSLSRSVTSSYSCDLFIHHRYTPMVKNEQKQPTDSVDVNSIRFNYCRLKLLKRASTPLAFSGSQFARHYSTSNVVDGSPQLQVSTNDLLFPDVPTIQGTEKLIEGIYNITGLPWWSTIILSAFLLRTMLPLPLSIYSMHNSVRLQRLQPEIKEIAQRLKKEVSMAMHQFGWDQKKAKGEFIKNMKRHLKTLYIRDNCHPMKDTASFWIRIPIWMSASYALRNMTVRARSPELDNHEGCQSLTTEGIAWFVDLSVVDSTWILPVAMGLVTLLNVEIGRRGISGVTTYRKILTFGLRGLSLAFIPISACLPSGLVLYWVSSGLFSAIQTMLVDRSSKFRRLIGIKPPNESRQHPSTESKSDGTKL